MRSQLLKNLATNTRTAATQGWLGSRPVLGRFATLPTPTTRFPSLVSPRHRSFQPIQMAKLHSLVQKRAPEWTAQTVVNGEIKPVSLADYKGKYVVMVFYPMDFTFVCPTELIAFSDRVAEFEKLNAQVLGVSVDSEFSHLAWTNLPRNKGGLGDMKIPLVSDLKKSISKDYGVLLENSGVALRGLFIIDPQGNVRIQHVNDLPIGRNVDEALRLIEAIQFYEKHGEVCPANWSKGGKTIKPSPKDSQEYFSGTN
ncbi:cTPxI [Dispira simplex]|nr:cTPxI [Dispira simplex]